MEQAKGRALSQMPTADQADLGVCHALPHGQQLSPSYAGLSLSVRKEKVQANTHEKLRMEIKYKTNTKRLGM
jgi:hypothetical protein